MNKSYKAHIQKIIDYNQDRLRHVPLKYRNLARLLQWNNKRFYKFIMGMWSDMYRQDATWTKGRDLFLMTDSHLNKAVGSRLQYLNYACCVGLADKVNPGFIADPDCPGWQSFEDDDWYPGMPYRYGCETYTGQIDHVSGRLNKAYDYRRMDATMIVLVKLDADRLDWADRMIGVYRAKGVTPANLTYDRLVVAGLQYDARRVLFQKYDLTSGDDKKKLWDQIVELVCEDVNAQGYCRKKEIVGRVKCSKKAFNDVWGMYRADLPYRVGTPTAEEVRTFSLIDRSHIIRP